MTTHFARSGRSSPIGKLSAKVEVRVNEDTKDELDRQARECGLGLGEFVRELLMIRAHGIDSVRRLYEHRLQLVSGMSGECHRDD
jgi:hypothetical protein